MSDRKRLTVVLPVYNEEKSLIPMVALINKHIDCQILAINDGSTDSSLQILKKLKKSHKNFNFVDKKKNAGHGAALKSGFSIAKTEFIACIDADMQYHPKYLKELLNVVEKENLDAAWCNRFSGKYNKMPIIRKVGNYMLGIYLFFITFRFVLDTSSGERLYRKSSLKKIDLQTLPDGLDMVCALTKRTIARGLKFKLIPCDYEEREGRSKLNIVFDFIRMVRNLTFEK